MTKVILGTTMSVDGFISDKDGNIGELYSDFVVGNVEHESVKNNELLQEAIRDTGAVIFGKKTFLMAGNVDEYADGYEFQVPIFVVTHEVPKKHPKENENLTFTFVTDGVESAVAQAKKAAKGRDVSIIGGEDVAHQILNAGLVDELHIDIMPILFGNGLRFFENVNIDSIKLEKIKVVEVGVRTHLRFRVINNS